MIWHIFRKDWKLLWRPAVAVAALQCATVAALYNLGHFAENRALASLVELLEVFGFFAAGCLIAMTVHQDAIPGVRQDWLVRPVKRRDLLFAKLLFLLLIIQGPMLLADFAEGLANGFSFGHALAAAASQNVYLLIGFGLPILAFASLTRNLTEAVVVGLAVFLCVMAYEVTSGELMGGNPMGETFRTGVEWIPEANRFALYFLGAVCILLVQYFRRKTVVSRSLLAGVVLLCLLTQLISWRSVFAVEQRLSRNPAAANRITMGFDPRLGRFQSPSGLSFDKAYLLNRWRRDQGDTSVFLPLRVDGLRSDSVLKADRSTVRLITPDGKTQDLGTGDDFEIYKEGPNAENERVHQGIHIRGDLYSRVSDQPVRLEVDYSLTLMQLSASYAIPALNGEQRVPGVGWCKTKINESGTAVQLRCIETGKAPYCGSFFLENAPSGKRNPEKSTCETDYAPYFGRYDPVDAMSRFGGSLPFRDPTGLAHYPVDGPQLADSRVVMRIYTAEDHFTRRLMIPAVRLKDWIPE